MKQVLLAATLLSTLAPGVAVHAAEPESCATVRFSDVGWTDITATTATTSVVLEALGYEAEAELLSVPVTYTSLKNGDVDVFLGNWMPTMEADIAPYREDGSVETVRTNLEGAKYTLAANAAAASLGIASFADIAANADALDGKIYGIEPGNDGNRLIQDMIDQDAFGLADFEVVESSEQGMLAQVGRATKRDEPIVFLGWEPHPMNANFELTYLEGGDDFFGPDLGGATVQTNVRAGLRRRVSERRQAARQPRLHAARDGERDHGRDPRRRRGARGGGDGLALGEPRRARRLARRRHHARRRARARRRPRRARRLTRRGGSRRPRRARAALALPSRCTRAPT